MFVSVVWYSLPVLVVPYGTCDLFGLRALYVTCVAPCWVGMIQLRTRWRMAVVARHQSDKAETRKNGKGSGALTNSYACESGAQSSSCLLLRLVQSGVLWP